MVSKTPGWCLPPWCKSSYESVGEFELQSEYRRSSFSTLSALIGL